MRYEYILSVYDRKGKKTETPICVAETLKEILQKVSKIEKRKLGVRVVIDIALPYPETGQN